MSAPRHGSAPGGGQCQEWVWAAWSARLGAEEQIWTCRWDLKALLCGVGSSRAPRANSPAVPRGMGQGLPSAPSSIGGCRHPLLGVTARPSAEPLSRSLEHKGDRGQRSFSRGGGAGSSLLPSGRDWAAAGSKQAAAGRPVPGSAGVAGGALPAAAKPWTAPDPASAGSAQTRFLASPPPRSFPSSKHPRRHGRAAAAPSAWLGLLCPRRVTHPRRGQTVRRGSDKG